MVWSVVVARELVNEWNGFIFQRLNRDKIYRLDSISVGIVEILVCTVRYQNN